MKNFIFLSFSLLFIYCSNEPEADYDSLISDELQANTRSISTPTPS